MPDLAYLAAFIQEWDRDPDGISMSASGRKLNEGLIRSPARVTVALDLSNHAITNAEGHKVRGGGIAFDPRKRGILEDE